MDSSQVHIHPWASHPFWNMPIANNGHMQCVECHVFWRTSTCWMWQFVEIHMLNPCMKRQWQSPNLTCIQKKDWRWLFLYTKSNIPLACHFCVHLFSWLFLYMVHPNRSSPLPGHVWPRVKGSNYFELACSTCRDSCNPCASLHFEHINF